MKQEVTRLKAERLRRRWTLKELSRRTRIADPDISKIERLLARPYPSQLKRLARAVRVPPEQLLEIVQIDDNELPAATGTEAA
jgi:transcriptional regulator with XRE-family HTH domain